MGSWYTCLIARPATTATARAFLEARGEAAALAERDGAVVIAPRSTESFDETIATELACALSRHLGSPVLAIHVADDSLFWYRLCGPSGVLDEYNSAPDYFDLSGAQFPPRLPDGGNATVLATAFDRPAAESAITAALHDSKLTGVTEQQLWEAVEANRAHEYLCDSAMLRHAAVVSALGLPAWSVEFGFKYLSAGHSPTGLPAEEIIFVDAK